MKCYYVYINNNFYEKASGKNRIDAIKNFFHKHDNKLRLYHYPIFFLAIKMRFLYVGEVN